MKFWSNGQMISAARIGAIWVIALSLVSGPAESQERPKLSDEIFKNIQVLKGIPVDDFLQTMGIMSGALGYDCSACHVGAGTDNVNWAADTPAKVTARRMVTIM